MKDPVDRTQTLLRAAVNAVGGTERVGQLQMAQNAAAAMAAGRHLVVQAGTGTGKSLAYLVPAVDHAVRTGQRVVVSTATLALQRQIVGRDLPRATSALSTYLPRLAVTALLKGWQNYLCLHKVSGGYPTEITLFDGADDSEASVGTLGEQILRLREWAQETDTGDRDDLVPGVSERAWRQVSVNRLECLGRHCPLQEECFAQRARQQAHEADLVVTNHTMLAMGSASGSLPEHQVLVVDEAHELVDRVTSSSTTELSAGGAAQVAALVRRLTGTATTDLDAAVGALAQALVAIPEGRFAAGLPDAVSQAAAQVRDASRALLSAVTPGTGVTAGVRQMAVAALTELFTVAELMAGTEEQLQHTVLWCDRTEDRSGRRSTVLRAAPLTVNGLIRARLLEGRAAVLTSATLTTGGSFDAAARAWGLFDAQAWEGLDVGSPFDYSSQGICYVAKHLPSPGREPATSEQLDEIEALIRAAGGRALGLFSSRRAAELAAQAIRERVGTPVLLQGDDQLPTLVQQFSADPTSSLFGTLSLWQGVDVPGDTCQLVIIDRIPFPRPDDPIAQARSAAVTTAGGNGFMTVAATSAALLLAQGAGRLIRSSTDRGVVAVLDPRLATARYGAYLWSALPPMWRTTDRQTVLAALARLDQLAVSSNQ